MWHIIIVLDRDAIKSTTFDHSFKHSIKNVEVEDPSL